MLRILCGGGNNKSDKLGELYGTPIKETQNLLGDVVGIWSGSEIRYNGGSDWIVLWSKSEWQQKFPGCDMQKSLITCINGDFGGGAQSAIFCQPLLDSRGVVVPLRAGVAAGNLRADWFVIGVRA